MNDPQANMADNGLLALGAPQADWTKAPGRVPGFWLALLGLILAVVLPVFALLVGAAGLAFTVQARRVIPSGARGSRLTLAAVALSGATLAVVLVQLVLSLTR